MSHGRGDIAAQSSYQVNGDLITIDSYRTNPVTKSGNSIPRRVKKKGTDSRVKQHRLLLKPDKSINEMEIDDKIDKYNMMMMGETAVP